MGYLLWQRFRYHCLNLWRMLARKLRLIGVSRTQFIRIAITHEIKNLEASLEQEAMAESMKAMKKSKAYLLEAEEIMEGVNTNLPKDKNKWWEK